MSKAAVKWTTFSTEVKSEMYKATSSKI